MLYAFKSGVTDLDQTQMNSLLSAQPTSLIFDGDQVTASTGSGTTENNLSTSDHSASFTLTGQTTIGRIELELKKYGVGADLMVEITDYATISKSFTFPKDLFSTGYISLPIDLSGLNDSATYTIVLKQAGDSINHLRWISESDGRKHYLVFANTPGSYTLRHGIYGENGKTIVEYTGENIAHIWRWLSASDGTMMICDKLVPAYDVNGIATKWGVE